MGAVSSLALISQLNRGCPHGGASRRRLDFSDIFNAAAGISEEDIIKKIALRDKAREDKDYTKSDLIRNELLDKGVLIEDKNGKTVWKFK